MEQVGQVGEDRRHIALGVVRWGAFNRRPVGPIGRDQRATFIRVDEQQVQPPQSVHSPQRLQCLTFKRVTFARNSDRLRKVVEVGSVSWFRSTTLSGAGYGPSSSNASMMVDCFA